MSLTYLKEITLWDKTELRVPNHTYIINDAGHLVGYIQTGTKEEIIFSKPFKQFEKTRRKFVELKNRRVT